jgi:single-strand DNA-binding protein
MLNKVMIIGHLGRDPELRFTQTGTPVATLSIATDESYTDKDGNKVERTEWHRVVVFQRSAENCSQYLSKGSLVFVEGKLQTRKWQDQQGQDRYSTEIKADRVQFLDRKGDRAAAGDDGAARRPQGGPRAPQRRPAYDEDIGPAFPSEASSMDDMPF